MSWYFNQWHTLSRMTIAESLHGAQLGSILLILVLLELPGLQPVYVDEE